MFSALIGSAAMFLIIGVAAAVGIIAFFIFSLIRACTRKTRGWIITSIFSGALMALLAVSILFMGVDFQLKRDHASRVAKFVSTRAAPTVLTSADGAVSIPLPAGWSSRPELAGDAVLCATDPGIGQAMMVFPASKSSSLDEEADRLAGVISGKLSGAESTKLEWAPVGLWAAARYRVTGRPRFRQVVYYLTVVDGPHCRYDIICSAWKSDDQALAPWMKWMTDNFHIIHDPVTSQTDPSPASNPGDAY